MSGAVVRRGAWALRALGTSCLLATAHCSLFFGLDGIDDGPPAVDASSTMDADGSGVDATTEAGPTADAANDGPMADATLADAADAAAEAGADAPGEAGGDGGSEAGDGGSEAGDGQASDAGDITTGLLALYRFDEDGGTIASDSTGNGNDGLLRGGAVFAAGLAGNAVTMDGGGQYVSLPSALTAGLSEFTVSAWVNLDTSPVWTRIFDFGSSQKTYAFLTSNSGSGMLRYAVTVDGGQTAEQRVEGPSMATGRWIHLAFTFGAGVGTLYANGIASGSNAMMSMSLASLGSGTQNWLGRSEFPADPFLSGQIDQVRIYSRALSPADVSALFLQHQ